MREWGRTESGWGADKERWDWQRRVAVIVCWTVGILQEMSQL